MPKQHAFYYSYHRTVKSRGEKGEEKWQMNLQELLNLYSHPTQYEQTNNIQAHTPWRLFEDLDDVKFYMRIKDDFSVTLLIAFCAGKTDHWVGWMINEHQARMMIEAFPTTTPKNSE